MQNFRIERFLLRKRLCHLNHLFNVRPARLSNYRIVMSLSFFSFYLHLKVLFYSLCFYSDNKWFSDFLLRSLFFFAIQLRNCSFISNLTDRESEFRSRRCLYLPSINHSLLLLFFFLNEIGMIFRLRYFSNLKMDLDN